MYIKIKERPRKKAPRSFVYREIKWRPYDWDPLQGTWEQKDEIPREPKVKWDIVLNKSSRENGKVKKQQRHIRSITYWDIVDGWYSESIHDSIEGYFKDRLREKLGISKKDLAAEKSLPSEECTLTNQLKAKWEEFELSEEYTTKYKKIDALIYEKLQPIIDHVKKEYKKSEENIIKTQNEKLKEAKQQEFNKKREEEKRRQKEYEEASYRAQEEYFNNFRFSSSGISVGSLKHDEKILAEEVIVAGYKQLSKKYHPDTGGTNEQFQQLGNIKNKLLEYVKTE